jgi:hypothetical protein
MTIKTHTSIAGLVLDELLNGKRLKQADYLEHTWRLAATIHYIEKRKGVQISRAPLSHKAVEYYLTSKEILRLRKSRNK